MKNNTLLGLVAIAISTPSVFAAEMKSDETVVVTANRFEQPISTVLAPINVVTRAEIDRWQAQTVPEILRRLPGVNIASNGGRGQLTSVFVRGTNSSQVLVLIDGIRMASPGITGSIDFSQIPVSLIQRIEYIRGPHAATYGSDAIGGVINIITESQEIGGQINVSYGTHAYQKYNLSARQALGDNSTIAIAGGYESTSGYNTYPAANEPDKDGFRGKSFWLGANHKFNDNISGFIRGWGYSNSTEYDSSSAWYPENERQLYSNNYDLGLQFSQEPFSSQLLASYQTYKDFNYAKDNGKNSTKPVYIKQTSLQWGNTYHFEYGTIVNGGIDYYKEEVKRSPVLVSNLSRINKGIYLTAQQPIGDFIFEGAARGDDNEQYGRHGTWQIAGSWAFIADHSIGLSYGTAFKAPTFSQIFDVPSWGILGNTDLKPEKSKQYEVSLDGQYDLFDWKLVAYRNEISNLITYKNQTYVNEKNATVKGAELHIGFDTAIFHHDISLEYIDSKNQAGESVARLPHKNVRYSIDADLDDVQLSLSYLYIGSRSDSDYNVYPTKPVTLGGVSTFDIAASYKVVSDLWIRGKIANIFDKKYETAYGYPNPGREFTATLSYDF